MDDDVEDDRVNKKYKSYIDVTLVIGVKLGYNIKSMHNFL